MSFNIPQENKKRVVIVGGGFGGLKLANKLKNSDFQVVLIDRNNYHQFPPLIYQVASSGLEPSSISFPFRKLFQQRKNFYFRMAELLAVHSEERMIETSIGQLDYDYLVLAAGTTTNFFGNEAVEKGAAPMKTVTEAMGLRNTILSHLERALTCTDESEREELLNIVIVGGGATGVEIAGVLSEMKRFILPRDYPDLAPESMRIHLIEAGDRLLASMSQHSSGSAADFLQRMGVDIQLNRKVVDYRDHKVIFADGSEIPSRTLIWVSGVKAVSIGNVAPTLTGRGGRIKVDEFNRIPEMNGGFVIGDQSLQTSDKDYPNGHPQLAQVAIQQGKQLAKNLRRMERGLAPEPFHYRNPGVMATVGRNRAVAEIGQLKMSGWFAWMLWLVVHLRSILGVRNKIVVLFNWVWSYLTYDQSLRLILRAEPMKEVSEQNSKSTT